MKYSRREDATRRTSDDVHRTRISRGTRIYPRRGVRRSRSRRSAQAAGGAAARRAPGRHVVDLGCGSGILARQLGDAGYRVVGIDASASMIALARERAPGADLRVGSFVSADLPACVAVTAIGEVLNYSLDAANDDEARAGLFRRVHAALVPGGIFLFDVAGYDRASPGRHRTFAEGPGWAVLVESQMDQPGRELSRTITSFWRVGTLYRRDVEVHRLALLDPAAVLESLRGIGFDAQAIPGYGPVELPRGVTAFLCRKSARGANAMRPGI